MKIAPFFLALALLFAPVTAIAKEIEWTDEECAAYLIADMNGQILAEKGADKPLKIASISKVMTYLIVKDAIAEGKLSLDTELTVSEHAASTYGSSAYLKEGETLTVAELLDAMMIISANDAASVLAEGLASTEDAFAKMMEAKGRELGFSHVHFVNASGLPQDETEDENEVTTKDLYKLAHEVITKYPEVLDYRDMHSFVHGETEIGSTMKLYGVYPGVDGLKTGYTEFAGCCLLTTVDMKAATERPEDDYRLIVIVMGAKSEDARAELTVELIDWAREHYEKKTLVDPAEAITHEEEGKSIPAHPESAAYALVKKGNAIETEDTYEITFPVEKGDPVGTRTVRAGDEVLATVPLIADEDVSNYEGWEAVKARVRFFFDTLEELYRLTNAA